MLIEKYSKPVENKKKEETSQPEPQPQSQSVVQRKPKIDSDWEDDF